MHWTGGNFILLTHLHIYFIWVGSTWLRCHLDDFHVLWKTTKQNKKFRLTLNWNQFGILCLMTHLGLVCLLLGNRERCLQWAVCATKLCKLVKTSQVRERRNIDCFDNCFAIAKETAPLVTMVSTSVLFYLQFSHRHHHRKNINKTKPQNISEKEK